MYRPLPARPRLRRCSVHELPRAAARSPWLRRTRQRWDRLRGVEPVVLQQIIPRRRGVAVSSHTSSDCQPQRLLSHRPCRCGLDAASAPDRKVDSALPRRALGSPGGSAVGSPPAVAARVAVRLIRDKQRHTKGADRLRARIASGERREPYDQRGAAKGPVRPPCRAVDSLPCPPTADPPGPDPRQ
jgi:hypothetical protein